MGRKDVVIEGMAPTRRTSNTEVGGGPLRRNANSSKKALDGETAPLLGSGSGSSSDTESEHGSIRQHGSVREHEWEGHADFDGLTWWHTPSMYWLMPPFFLFALAVGGILVPKLNLALSLVCRNYFVEKAPKDPTSILPVLLGTDNPQCRIPEVQALATKFMLYITIITGTLSAIVSPKMGALSDRYGRLKLLAITSLGGLISEIITIAAATYPDTIHYNWLLVGAVFDGICGSFIVGMALTHAYAADCTAPLKRGVAFGYFHACLFSGIALGPLLAAFAIKLSGSLIVPFYVALGIHTIFILFILVVVPESLTKKRQLLARERYAVSEAPQRGRYSWLILVEQGNILAPLRILFPTGAGTSNHLRANLILLSAVDTIVFGIPMGGMTVVVFYCGFQFHWDTAEISAFTSIVNIFRVSCLVIILPLLNYLFRTRRANRQRRESGFAIRERNSGSDILDLSIIRAAIAFEIIGYASFATVRTGPLFLLSGIVSAVGGIGSPTLQSALTKHVPHDKIGQLLGATGLLHALARIVCPLIFNLIYVETVGLFPQAVFVVFTGCFGFAFLFSWFIRPNIYLEDSSIDDEQSAIPDDDILVDEEIAAV